MQFDDLNFHDIGTKIGLVGAVFADDSKEEAYLCMLPDQDVWDFTTVQLRMDLEDWKRFLRQTDLQEMPVLQRDETGKLAKAIVRKTQRVIDNRVSWAVYKRDSYACRYCGRDGLPLTVDHLILWEEGGPSIESNLVTACRKCNKVRGDTQYEEWLDHPYYKKVSANLPPGGHEKNMAILMNLDQVERVANQRSRR